MAQRGRGLAPGQQREAVLAHALDQRRGDRGGIGVAVGPARQTRSRRAAARAPPRPRRSRGRTRRCGASRCGRRTALRPSPGRSPPPTGCARRRRCPASRRPRAIRRVASGSAGSSRNPRPPTDAQRSPDASRRRDDAVGEGEGDGDRNSPPARGRGRARACRGCAAIVDCALPSPSRRGGEQLRPPLRQPPRTLRPRPALAAKAAHARLEVGSRPAQPALAEQHRDLGRLLRQPHLPRADQHVREARRHRQPRDRAAVRGRAAVGVERLQRRQPRPRLRHRGVGRRVEPAQRRADRRRPRSRSRAPAPTDRPRGFRAGRSAAGPAVAASSHRRYATPGPCRAARPARCVAAAWLARSVTSRVIPAARS